MSLRQDNTMGSKYYVVFKGGKPGIYKTWVDCYAQVHAFQNTAFKSFCTYAEAINTWNEFTERGLKGIFIDSDDFRGARTSGTGQGAWECVPQISHDNYAFKFKMQHMLQQVCIKLHIEHPLYNSHDTRIINGRSMVRFRGALRTPIIGHPPVSMSRFADTPDEAREDVAVMLLRRLVACSGKIIGDFNQCNLRLYEEQITYLEVENFDLLLENARLHAELKKASDTLAIKML